MAFRKIQYILGLHISNNLFTNVFSNKARINYSFFAHKDKALFSYETLYFFFPKGKLSGFNIFNVTLLSYSKLESDDHNPSCFLPDKGSLY